jgi:glucokinase
VSAAVIGVDIGGTKIAAGLLDGDARTELGELPTVRGDGVANAASVRELVSRAGTTLPVGLSVTTTLDSSNRMRDHSNWLGWSGWTAEAVLGSSTRNTRSPSLSVAANDALCGALAEDWAGDSPEHGILVYVTLGTGIAHTTVVDGTALAGAHGSALFTGWTPAGLSASGASGPSFAPTWEELCAGPALARAFDGTRNARPLAAAAATGDPRAQSILEEGARWFGLYLATLIQTYDPHRVVVGGGLAAGLPAYVDRAAEHARAAVRQPVFRDTPILAARLGAASGWTGAGLIARRAVIGTGRD